MPELLWSYVHWKSLKLFLFTDLIPTFNICTGHQSLSLLWCVAQNKLSIDI